MIHQRIRPTAWLPLAALLPCILLQVGRAGEFEVALEGPEKTFVVENAGPDVVPTVYLVGLPDRESEPVHKSKGLTLNGLRLSETLLSESVLIFYPDGSARWGYHAGFDIFREPQFDDGRRVDPRSLVEYDKWKYDPLEPVRVAGGDMNLLLLHAQGPMPAAVYEIAFPDPVRIRSLEVRSNCDQLGTEGVVVRARLFADPERKRLIAETSVGPGAEHPRFPVRFDGLDQGRVFLELSAEAPRGVSVGLYYT
ncbi:MAG: hypothetical protein HQ582_15690, partial [Planctomycetes bacterium]|nr:hypothetical protein [Planctomycetota bacterium]